MELSDRALPLTRGQLDRWLAQETGRSGTEWQLGLFARFDGRVKPDLFEQAAIRLPPNKQITFKHACGTTG
jgi:hypothetical protein